MYYFKNLLRYYILGDFLFEERLPSSYTEGGKVIYLKIKEKPLSLSTFIKMHSKSIQKFSANYIYFNTSLTNQTCDIYAYMTETFVDIIDRESTGTPIDMIKAILKDWFERQQFFLTSESIQILEEVLNKAIEEFCESELIRHDLKKELNGILDIVIVTLKTSQIKFVDDQQKNKGNSLLDVLDILITHDGYQGIVHTLKKIEEKFSFKRSSYYSYLPETREVMGVFGEEMSKINKLRKPLLSQKPFIQTYHSKRALLIENPQFYFEEELIKEFQLSTVVVVPVYSSKEMLGWLVLDNVGEVWNEAAESLNCLEEIGELLGIYINKIGYYEFTKDPILLSEREKEVLRLLGEGFDNKEIGFQLLLSEHTVRDYISQLMIKMNAKNRTHLVSIAFRKQLIK